MPEQRSLVICFGEALIDLLALPREGGGRIFEEHAGGAPANVAVGVARLGGKASFAGMLSTDMFGDLILDSLSRFGVELNQIRRTDQARTALAFVALDKDGERTFSFYRPPSADLLFRFENFDVVDFESAAVFHACSNSMTDPDIAETTVKGMRLASEMGALVSFDLNFRPMLWKKGVDPDSVFWGALKLAHLVKLSSDELKYLARTTSELHIVERLLSNEARVIIVTDGASTMRWWTRSSSGQTPTLRVTAIDTTAAGDAFVAGLLHILVKSGINGDKLGAAFDDESRRHTLLRFASAVGALATTRHGAFAAMPTESEVLELVSMSEGSRSH